MLLLTVLKANYFQIGKFLQLLLKVLDYLFGIQDLADKIYLSFYQGHADKDLEQCAAVELPVGGKEHTALTEVLSLGQVSVFLFFQRPIAYDKADFDPFMPSSLRARILHILLLYSEEQC